ncbi:ThuA domain-containing protein [Naasia sp. SYSU D00948]|uniref:ThuA domain-containing protein n=1 Tax=Naasia sp. SYSU D00948 TaxID=2817379 RepID=UPI001B308CA6|nr:ThuA domain-containing protein [Naasia sp. SYSU D00948]
MTGEGAQPAAERPRALLLTGVGRYADPWHPFEQTSDRLREILTAAGYEVHEPQDVDAALAAYTDGAPPSIVVANLGKPRDGLPSPALEARPGLERLLSTTPILAVHAAANSFPDSDLWATTIGARWVDGRAWHPPFGRLAAVPESSDGSPLGPLRPFELDDERYLGLDHHGPVLGLYRHADEDGVLQPSVWLRNADGRRAAYDAYGHDERAYASDAHRDLLLRIVRWLTRSSH